MNSPITSVSQTSAPVAALRAALPTQANERVEAALGSLADLEKEIDAFGSASAKGFQCWQYSDRLDAFSRLGPDMQESFRRTALDARPEYGRLRAKVSASLPAASASRLNARLDDLLEEIAATSPVSSSFLGPKAIFDADKKFCDLSESQAFALTQKSSFLFLKQSFSDVADDILEAFPRLFANAETFNLTNCFQANPPEKVWRAILPVISRARTVSFSANALVSYPEEAFRRLADALREKVDLCLAANWLGLASPKALSIIAPVLSVPVLSLQNNGLAKLPPDSWETLLPSLGSVDCLNVSYNDLGALPAASWGILAPTLSRPRSLDLSSNNLGALPFEAWEILAPHLGAAWHLDLSHNMLADLPVRTWKVVAPQITKVRSLCLYRNHLADMSPEAWEVLAPELVKVPFLQLESSEADVRSAMSQDQFEKLYGKNSLSRIDPAVWAPLSARPKGPDFQY